MNTKSVTERLHLAFPNHTALVEEYVREVLHQEGEDVWRDWFANRLSAVINDFVLYRDSKNK